MSRIMSVKRIFSFSSGTLNRLGIGLAMNSAPQQVYGPASRLDLAPGRSAHRMHPENDLPPDLAVPVHLDRPARAQVDQPVRVQHLRRDRLLFDPIQVPEVHDLVDLPEPVVVEPTLRNAPLQGHLAALEATRRVSARAGLVTLVPPPARLPDPRPRTTAHPLRGPVGALRATEVAQLRHYASPPPSSSTSTRCWTWKIIPRMAGVSFCTTERWCPLSPSARRVARCLDIRPMPLRTCVIRSSPADSVLTSFLATAYPQFFHRDPSLGRNLLRSHQLLEPGHRGPHHVDRVVRAKALRQHVRDPGRLEHRAHRPTGDHARTRTRRLQQYATGTMVPQHLVGDRAIDQRHLDHLAPRLLEALPDRLRYLVRLPQRDPDVPVPIPDRHQRSEREPASALHDLRHAVHEHHVLDQLRIRPGTTAARAASLLSRHALLLLAPPGVALELESAGARAFGKRGDTPMIEITAAIEHDPLHPDRLRPLRQQLPGLAAQIRLRRLRVLPQRLQLRRLRRNTDQDLPAHIVDEVPLNVLQRAEHHQPRTTRMTCDLLPHPTVPPRTAHPPLLCILYDRHRSDPPRL